ncbi:MULTISPECIES: sulfotransferase family 2 domain-containing protein [Rhodobacterales]|uniref:Sulfotransferase family 2 domain-containing protein n=1 Tax=Phaeobacter gallaeciensis TaxID=60890 RepID=A0ABD4X5E0_9RHOB|nr:sulfotransferase family 2 domain-containing protein [Phaeobacter gallaeciensis]MDF1770323.1 sulfotransferase family 2 domain-containing protein [Pseudophaeobacter sp. bin_em_oilr2.035]MDE4143340.1 sulfotransferase family 2 domain-containing protein [Phaeobacter gallaeciensis]MDE4156299.1 sulfotransferase family 2 domain-containing protein [Phaeobacter gallaeciensis]MDE4160486.1 sulfotransferase family 2 domain-containing protein [Phaeobacter gallaeciensis]MDE4164420.1 sulfotransferase famil
MILSPGRNFVFIHIPKTGGTSLSLALEARAMKDDMMLGDTPKARNRRRRLKDVQTRGRLWKHSTLADIEGLLPEDQMRGLFAFTLVRNPFDRAVSYYHWLRDQTFDHPAVTRSKALDFREFILHSDTLSAFRAHPPRSYMRHADGSEQCQAYIRIEYFEKDAEPLFDHLGFRLDLERANASVRARDWREYYDPQSRAALAASCAEEIEQFEYSFNV